MRNVWIISRREYKQYFSSWVAYIFVFIFMLLLGLLFYINLRGAITQALYQAYAPSVQIVIGPMVTLFIIVLPAITMRTIAEEARMGTMEILLTAPVKDWELVVGKWLGAFLFTLSLLAVTWVYPIILNFLVTPGIDQGILITGYLGLALMVASLLAIGVFISSLFNNQLVAFFVTIVIILALWFISQLSSTTGGLGSQLLSYFGYVDHFYSFYQGSIDLSDAIYYLSLTSLGLFLGTVSVEMRRWR